MTVTFEHLTTCFWDISVPQLSYSAGKDCSNLVFIYIHDFGTKWASGGYGVVKDHLFQKRSAHMVTMMH